MTGKSTRGRRRFQLVDDLLETKNCADLEKATEDSSVWRTIKKRPSQNCSVSRSLMNEWMHAQPS